MALASLELTPAEIDALLVVVRGRLAELERNLQQVEEAEGMDATKFNARRLLLPQIEGYQDLALKLEAAARDARR